MVFYKFWEDIDELIQGVPNRENIFIRRDMNGNVGNYSGGFSKSSCMPLV